MATKPQSSADDLSVEEIQKRHAARKAAPGLTPEEIKNLQLTYRDVVLQDDDDAKAILRAIKSKLRRVSHAEIHPACAQKVEVDVPLHPMGVPFLINEKPYRGHMEVWPCEARQLAAMVEDARRVERERLREGGRVTDLDNPVAARARAIAEA